MASTNGTSRGDFDERLAEALQGALIGGEEVTAQEVGDQGQAIVLTGSRIIILKVGLAATGELNGHRASAYALDSVTAINLRKGPLGAVIQVCADDARGPVQNPRPDNVVVFTGPGRVKKAEAFAATIESAAGKSVNRIDPHSRVEQPADKPVVEQVISTEPLKGGREPRSLAEEIYSEVAQSQPEPVAQAQDAVEVVPVIWAAELESEDKDEEQLVPLTRVNPNPLLPKPIRKRVSGPNGLLVALGVLAALVFVGMAVMAPLHEVQTVPVPAGGSSRGSGELNSVRLQLIAVSNYQSEVRQALGKANAEANAFRAAVRTANRAAIQSAARSAGADQAWQKLSGLSVPLGLAEAKQNITNGLMVRRNAITAAAGSSEAVDVRETLSRFDEADAQITKGLAAISATRAGIEKQISELAKAAKDRKGRH